MTMVRHALSPYFSTPSISASICSVVQRVLRLGVRAPAVAVVYAAEARASSTMGMLSSSSGTCSSVATHSTALNCQCRSLPKHALQESAQHSAHAKPGQSARHSMHCSTAQHAAAHVHVVPNAASTPLCQFLLHSALMRDHLQLCMHDHLSVQLVPAPRPHPQQPLT
jgi:hypothetical protein